MDTCCLGRILDLVFDPRMPHSFTTRMLRARKLRQIMKCAQPPTEPRTVFLVLTFDVESEYGSHPVGGNGVTASQFLGNIQNVSENMTIFVQGSLVQQNSEILRSLERQGIEIGLHGYRHELWGPAQWYLADKPLTLQEKKSLLEAGIEAFRTAGLRSPAIFRSPNLVADTATLRLLAEKGFRVDSSLPSHRGLLPVPVFFGGPEGLIRIPVTVDPTPSLSRKVLLPYYRYFLFDLKNLKEMKTGELLQHVSRVVVLQETLGFLPHLVILCHSWEFLNPLAKEWDYCCPANFEFLRNLDSILSENFSVRHVSMSTLAEQFKGKKTDAVSFRSVPE